jgi:hypothetical protein
MVARCLLLLCSCLMNQQIHIYEYVVEHVYNCTSITMLRNYDIGSSCEPHKYRYRVTRWRSGWGTSVQTGRSRVRFPMSLEFFIDIILPAALWPWVRLSLWQKWVPGIFSGGKGGRWVGLTTLPPSCADCLKIWVPQPPETLRACQGLYWDCFTFQMPLHRCSPCAWNLFHYFIPSMASSSKRVLLLWLYKCSVYNTRKLWDVASSTLLKKHLRLGITINSLKELQKTDQSMMKLYVNIPI